MTGARCCTLAAVSCTSIHQTKPNQDDETADTSRPKQQLHSWAGDLERPKADHREKSETTTARRVRPNSQARDRDQRQT